MDEQFNFSKKYRNVLILMMAGGILITIGAIVVSRTDASRIWANILLNNQFFMGIALGAAFFIAVHRVALSGWHTILQGLPDAMTSFLPVAFVLMLLIYFGMHNLYHWSHYEGHDPVLEVKKVWLNIPFFFIRMILYFTGWIALTWLMRKNSAALISSSDLKFHNRRKIFAGLFLAFYGITVSASSWDWIMSLNPHWDSTIFGWYVFIGMFVTSLTAIIILTWFLRYAGYLKYLRPDHVHDLGILLFSFSIFWTYLWFSQYLLIWYGHIPQETSYYIERMNGFKPFFFINLVFNFIIPFFGLIRVSSKRHLNWLTLVAALVLIGHWLDYWLMIMPATAGAKAGIGVLEIFMTLFYAGMFIFVVFRSLARYPFIVKNDPFLEESMSYES
jgi:hypothetical protein